jgi:hypothetical protein
MFDRSPKPIRQSSLPNRRSDAASPRNAPQSASSAAALPNFAVGEIAVHPPAQAEPATQLRGRAASGPRTNRTGLPDDLKAGVEAMSGVSLDGVKVHYNSPHPERLGAHAYARGREIHVARGQERHLPHEAWHLVQQAQGRVRPGRRIGPNVPVNEDRHLEREADVMGAKAASRSQAPRQSAPSVAPAATRGAGAGGAAGTLAPTAAAPAQLNGDEDKQKRPNLIGAVGAGMAASQAPALTGLRYLNAVHSNRNVADILASGTKLSHAGEFAGTIGKGYGDRAQGRTYFGTNPITSNIYHNLKARAGMKPAIHSVFGTTGLMLPPRLMGNLGLSKTIHMMGTHKLLQDMKPDPDHKLKIGSVPKKGVFNPGGAYTIPTAIAPHYMIGSPHFSPSKIVGEAVKSFPRYVKSNPARFGRGGVIAGVGLNLQSLMDRFKKPNE